MSERPSDLREEVRHLAAEELAGGGDHPPPEELIAYHERSLPEPRAEELRDHLAVCSECAALLLDFEEHWADSDASAPEPEYVPWYRRPGPPWALAAGLGAVALGLIAWFAVHGPGGSSLYLTENLRPGAMRGESDAPRVIVPATYGSVGLVLDAREIWEPASEVVFVATLTAGGEIVARAEGPIDEPGEFILTVARRELRAGDYEVVLRSRDGSTELEYGFQFVESGAEPGAPAEAEPGAER